MTKARSAVLAAGVLAAVGGTFCWWSGGVSSSDHQSPKAAKAASKKATCRKVEKPEGTNRTAVPEKRVSKSMRNVGPFVDKWMESIPMKHRKLAQGIVDCSDGDDLPGLRKLVGAARECPNADVRLRMVEALGWFGQDAVVELTGFLSDGNSEVSHSAFNAWETAVDQMPSETVRLGVATSAMTALKDKNALMALAAKFEAASDRKTAIRSLSDVIAQGTPEAADMAKEAYRNIVGEDWQGPGTALLKSVTIDRDENE